MNDYDRIFFHELGHFIAATINNYFDPSLEPHEITLERHPMTGEFRGSLQMRVSNDHTAKVPPPDKSKIAEYLAQIYYGCIFQSYYLKTDLSDCLGAAGLQDQHLILGIVILHKLSGIEPDLHDIASSHLELLFKTNKLDDFKKLDTKVYLVNKNENHFIIDISRLQKDTTELVQAHIETYVIILEKFRNVLTQYV